MQVRDLMCEAIGTMYTIKLFDKKLSKCVARVKLIDGMANESEPFDDAS